MLAREQLVRIAQITKNRQLGDSLCPATLKADNTWQARVLSACAASVLDRSDQSTAEAFAQLAADSYDREQSGALAYEQVQNMLTIAKVNRQRGRLAEAETAINKGLVLCDRYLGPYHVLRGELLDTKAHVLASLKRKSEAKKAAQQYEAILSSNKGTVGNPRLVDVKPLKQPYPTYTEAARSNRIEGTVVILCEIKIDGQVRPLLATNKLGYGLDEAAFATILQWRFEPMRKDGHAVSIAATIQVNFKLR